MLDELRRALKASRIPLPIDNHGANAGDLWAGDGRFIGNIDEPLYAAVLVAAVNALPEMERLEAEVTRFKENLERTREDLARTDHKIDQTLEAARRYTVETEAEITRLKDALEQAEGDAFAAALFQLDNARLRETLARYADGPAGVWAQAALAFPSADAGQHDDTYGRVYAHGFLAMAVRNFLTEGTPSSRSFLEIAMTRYERSMQQSAAQRRALPLVIEAARGHLREGTPATRTVLEVALKRLDEVTP